MSKQHSPTKQTNHTEKNAAAHSENLANRSSAHKAAASPAKQVTRQQALAHDHQTTTGAHNRRRRRPTFGQRLAHLSGGSWLAILTGAVVIGIIVFALIASRGSSTPGTTSAGLLANGTTAPAIAALPAADGKSYSLAQYKGEKVVVLEFFAPWCPHCQNETTALKQLQQEYGSKGVQVLSVSASPYGRNYEQGDQSAISMTDIQWFSSNFSLNYPALFDPSLNAGTDYKVSGFPTLYIVNKQGVITYSGSGEISYASLQQQVSQALGQ